MESPDNENMFPNVSKQGILAEKHSISGSCTVLIQWILLTCHCLPCWELKRGHMQLGTWQYLCVHSESRSGALSGPPHQWRGARNPESGAASATDNEQYFTQCIEET
jgi:hypothetical protein